MVVFVLEHNLCIIYAVMGANVRFFEARNHVSGAADWLRLAFKGELDVGSINGVM